MTFRINDITGALRSGGARPTLFNVNVTNPVNGAGDEAMQFLCETAQLPGSTIGPIEVPYFGRKIKLAGDRTFEAWTVTIINDEDFAIRNAMEAWHSAINGLTNNLRNFPTASPSEYKSAAQVIQYGKTCDLLREYSFVGLFPTEISSIDLDWGSTDTIEKFTVTFQYDYYELTRGSTLDGTVA